MKGTYISNLDPAKSTGYEAKILGQIKGFNKLGVDIDFIHLASDGKIVLSQYSANQIEVNEKFLGFFYENILLKRISLYKAALKVIKRCQPDFIYLRHPRSDPLYINFLKSVKKLDSSLIIISEIPTYPYDGEYRNSRSIKDRLLIFLDQITRNKLNKYIDRIVVIAYDGDVFGIPSINLTNGIDTSNIRFISQEKSIDDEINLIGVGNIDFWHGYDRLIVGLSEYSRNNNTSKVKLNIISPERETVHYLRELTLKLNLSDDIIFHGAKYGSELDKLYSLSHLAIGDLGGHRKKIFQTSALKTREYVARGIPFIHSAVDTDFNANFKYCLTVPANDEAINIDEVIIFLEYVMTQNKYSEEIRKYAEEYLDWSIKLEPVIEEIISTINAGKN